MFKRDTLTALVAALVAGPAVATPTLFSTFTPTSNTIGVDSLPAATPFLLSSPSFTQRTIVERDPMQTLRFDSGAYDMHTLNETGPDAGRYLFSVFETAQAGIQRTDLLTGTTVTLWHSPAPAPALNSHVAFDASRWTPWGTYLTAEESWVDPGQPASQYGRAFEVTNPLADPADINIRQLSILPRVSHEGMAFDKNNNFYFIDERNDSHIFKYVSKTPTNGATFWDKGQSFVMRVGDGTVEESPGAVTWIALTDVDGVALPGTNTGTDPNGLPILDGRETPNSAAFLGTNFDRPEDMEIQTLGDGSQKLYFTTTTNDKVFSLDLDAAGDWLSLFVDQNTLDMSTGAAVGTVFNSPDNLAIDAEGTIYVIEDQPGGQANIWYAKDADRNGVADAIGVWATLATAGAEPTGLYFDPFNPNRAWVNVQHPTSGIDRTIEITAVPEAETYALLLAGLGLTGVIARRRRA